MYWELSFNLFFILFFIGLSHSYLIFTLLLNKIIETF
jgi:hypothetical protein